ncbi:MAG: TolC family protein, partial [Kiritimatiellae bacterium]|nr:TolC family protein [Kiritimatiellia bacterium]
LAAADMAERAAENQAAYGVRSACFALGRARELLEVAHATSESYREHRDQTKDRRDVGAAMDYEVSKAEVDYQNALLSEISAANAVETARASLCLALGLAENPDIALGDCSFPEIPGTAAELMEIARTNAPALAALKASADAAKDYVDWTICDLYPKLSFSLTFDAKGDSSPLLWNYAAVPAAAQNLFSAGAKTRQIEAAVAQLRAARSKLAQAEQETWNAIVLATLAADRARKSLSVAETALDAAKENFEVVANRYEVGKASALERTDAQVALSAAEASVVTARCDLQDTQILLARIVGL